MNKEIQNQIKDYIKWCEYNKKEAKDYNSLKDYLNLSKLLKEAKADASVLTLKSYETLAKIADGQSTKIIIPSDMKDIASFGTVINEMIDKKK